MAITVCRGASRRIPRRPDPDIGLDGASTNLQHPVCSCCNLDCLCPLGWWRCLKMLAVGYTPSSSLLRPSCGTENSIRQSIRLPSITALGSERPACEFSAPGHWSSLPNFATEKTWISTGHWPLGQCGATRPAHGQIARAPAVLVPFGCSVFHNSCSSAARA